MRKIKDILRQRWLLERPQRQIAQALEVGLGTVNGVVQRATEAGLSWEIVAKLSETELAEKLYPRRGEKTDQFDLPSPERIDLELRKPGVTLRLLHLEYRERFPAGCGYTKFWRHYTDWRGCQNPVMRLVHRAGEKAFSDYAGKKPHWVDPMTGEMHAAELFVCVLGASNYTFARASETQRVGDWIHSHIQAVEFFGGVPELIVPDQLKSAVSVASPYEPEIQRTFEDWATHYGTAVLPARPRRPRDKAKVEVAVLIVERWILARLRHQTFFSLDELNARIAELVVELNARTMRRYGKSRRQMFEELDRGALKALPTERFECATWRRFKVHIDYHVAVDHHYYSVPSQHVGQEVEVAITARTVEIFLRGQRLAAHRRSDRRGQYTTVAEHMPKAHQRHAQWTPTRLILWAKKVGPFTAALVEAILIDRPHPEMGYRSCLGLMRLSRAYGSERMELASARALAVKARSYRHVESILKSGLDRLPAPTPSKPSGGSGGSHENIRGKSYYH